MENICPNCNVIYNDRTVCPLCFARLQPYGESSPSGARPLLPVARAGAISPAMAILGAGQGVIALLLVRFQYGTLLRLHQAATLPGWLVFPAVVALSMTVTLCAFSCAGLLSRRGWGIGEARRALRVLLFAFPVGTVWGAIWLAYLRRREREAWNARPNPVPPPLGGTGPVGGGTGQ